MKVRSSFVSNSSSSSFIVMADETRRNPFGKLSFDDWKEVVDKIYRRPEIGPEEYVLMDLSDKVGKKKAMDEFGDHLGHWEGWFMLWKKDGSLEWNPGKYEDNARIWEQEVEEVAGLCRDAYAVDGYYLMLCAFPFKKMGLDKAYYKRSDDSDGLLGRPLDEKMSKRLERAWKKLGLTTGDEILENPKSMVLAHFDDNVIWEAEDLSDEPTEAFSTESYTFERVCEVLARKFVELGKVPPGTDWRDLYRLIGHCSIHEG